MGDDGTDKPPIVDIADGQYFAAKAATTSHFQVDDDDSDDEDEFFVDQHQHTLSGANTSTHRNTGDTACSTVSDIDDDDFFVSEEQARPSSEGVMPYKHNKGEEIKLKAVKESAVPSDTNVHGGVKFDDDSRSDKEYRMDNCRDRGEPTSLTESLAPPRAPMKMESSSPRPSTSGTNNSSPAVSQPPSVPTASGGSGISAAALAAIQAAQRNAEAMLLLQTGANDPSSDQGSIIKKAKKKKKDGKSKKKKKKDKSQFVGDAVDVSD
jgi:hypothetical protein